MRCPNCQEYVLESSTFCPKCGHWFDELQCPNCHDYVPEGSKICINCGIRLREVGSGKAPIVKKLFLAFLLLVWLALLVIFLGIIVLRISNWLKENKQEEVKVSLSSLECVQCMSI
jgi:RNA polymerase subunit RPABC4/transcription elongation factor Spt4